MNSPENFSIQPEPIEKIGYIKKEGWTPEQLIEFRFKQSDYSRLCEYITGLQPEDPRIVERLKEDHEIIRARYNLPNREMIWYQPSEYERFLRAEAEKTGVTIREKSDCGSFFKDNGMAGGVYFDENKTIGSSIDKTDKDSMVHSLSILEHELIHAKQHKAYPDMMTEQMEYEAYVAGLNTDNVANAPAGIGLFFFGFSIGGSVEHWYTDKNNERPEGSPEILPKWDNPEYFLKHVDHVDEKLIEEYKAKK
ncbi:MAG: hypothetical protein WCF94_02320 [bacterium]